VTGEAESEALEASAEELPTGTVTFLFSDIEESTRLVGELSLPAYRELIEQHHRLLREAFQQRGGYERGTQGDGFLVVFGDAIAALEAAVAVQRSLDSATWPEGVEVRVRIGLHSGRGSLGGDDYIGLDINRAARIAAAAHGGQILISNATRALVDEELPSGVSARYVGEYELKGLDAPERLHQLDIEGLRNDFPLPRAPSPTLDRLPSRLTTFVGREGDIDALRGLLESSRLITLTGPGGSGKTSLAVELAREMVHDFPDGTWFVDLSTLTDPDLVIPTVARSLGLVEQHERSIGTVLIEHLASRDLLLVLDNFEQVAPAAGIIPSLLESSPGIRMLVTSRSILGVYGEQSYPLQPLGLPDDDVAGDLTILERSEAAALFVDRATAARPGFSVTSENASAIAEICIRLDGLPLAIELVATRVRHLTPQEILDRIETHRPVLATSGDDRPARQRTLDSTIAWSYDLLPPVEQDLFTRLSIFTGGFRLEAAEAICNTEHELGMDTLDGLISLTDQSLVHRVAVEGTSRFRMLETIREYGRHLLWASDRRDELIGRHLVYYCELAEQAEQHLIGQDQEEWLDRIEVEHANLRSALGRAIDTNRAEEGLRISAALWRFWMQRGYLREGRAWLEKMLAMESDSALVTRAKAYTALGGLAFWLFAPDATKDAYESAMAIYRQLGDQEAEAAAMYNLAFVRR
jgi:predicted ATPase/class 3 adenylate cyclase